MVINLIITIGLLELYACLTQPIRPLLVVKQTIDKLVPLAESDPKQSSAGKGSPPEGSSGSP
ncbi:hypothetical protein CBI30_10510 [Polynucleobacter aenigmaticus]|uniref:Uncharacterized protein n=1 Tax=Polynucleobacter aenigmaticus TaxID=1743164 RepID=A0A254PXI8_9BURK|nr:hypothetical protein CBI30_10510 [Polynucleobacter aenigmaticus]